MEDNLNKIISINDIISIMSLHDYLQDFVPQCITQSLKSSKKYSTSQNCCQLLVHTIPPIQVGWYLAEKFKC